MTLNLSLPSFTTFWRLLKYCAAARRLTQLELSIAVGTNGDHLLEKISVCPILLR
jgi:hypothetical protein